MAVTLSSRPREDWRKATRRCHTGTTRGWSWMRTSITIILASIVCSIYAVSGTVSASSSLPSESLRMGEDRLWDLSGIVLAFAPPETIRWTTPTHVDHVPDGLDSPPPMIRFTLFAEWEEEEADEMRKHTRRVCEVISTVDDDDAGRRQCVVGHLPRGVAISFVVTATCDATGRGESDQCSIGLSSSLTVTLETTDDDATRSLLSVESTASLTDVSIDRIANDSLIRADLAEFYVVASGAKWTNNTNWLRDDVSLCDWYGVICDTTRTVLIGYAFKSMGLVNEVANRRINASMLFEHINTLLFLQLTYNTDLCLTSLDLSAQVSMQSLLLYECGYHCRTTTVPVILPVASNLIKIDLTSSYFQLVNASMLAFDQLEWLELSSSTTPFPMALFTVMPSLLYLEVYLSNVETTTPDSAGRTGGALVHAWLGALNETNPQLTTLIIGGAVGISFDLDDGASSNWPAIASDSLTSLTLGAISLRTTTAGPPRDWLISLPALQSIELYYLTSVYLNLSCFELAGASLVSISAISTAVTTDLSPLYGRPNLLSLTLSDSGIRSELPDDVAAVWPLLTNLVIENANIDGSLPTFANLTQLVTLDISGNTLRGQIPRGFLRGSIGSLATLDLATNLLTGSIESALIPTGGLDLFPALTTLTLNSNNFTGTIDRLFGETKFPLLTTLALQSNEFGGALPSNLWAQMPLLVDCSFAGNDLVGPIPDVEKPRAFSNLDLSTNSFSSTIPYNITATMYDVSYNSDLTGAVLITDEAGQITLLNLAFTNLTCPIDLSKHTALESLDLQSAGFDGCDFNDDAQVNLPLDTMLRLDISNNNWTSASGSFSLAIPPLMLLLTAVNARISSLDLIAFNATQYLPLRSIDISGNPFDSITSSNMIDFLLHAQSLSFLKCNDCNLDGDVSTFSLMNSSQSRLPGSLTSTLYEVHLANNRLSGRLPPDLFTVQLSAQGAMPLSLRVLDLSGNTELTGPLPAASTSFTKLQEVYFKDTAVTGSLPASWSAFVSLTRLEVENTSLVCDTTTDDGVAVTCSLPTWLSASTSVSSSSTLTVGASCPALIIQGDSSSTVTIDESYYQQSLCSCDDEYFGTGSVCRACSTGCTCAGAVVTSCFPIVVPALSSYEETFTSVSIPLMLTCPLTSTGITLCNYDGAEWNFDQTNLPLSALDLTSFCYEGHTDRVCSKCARGYYPSGRWCLSCGSVSLHTIIVIINVGALLVLCAFTYSRLPTVARSVQAMRLYLDEELAAASIEPSPVDGDESPSGCATPSKIDPHDVDIDEPDHDRLALSRSAEFSNVSHSSMSLPFSSSQAGGPAVQPTADADVTQASSVTSSAATLRLLVFHCQSLSLLLQTETSQPAILTSFFSFVSSSSTGFSLSSLIALECLSSAWDIAHKCWMGLLGPSIILSVAAIVYVYQRRRQSQRLAHGWSTMTSSAGRSMPVIGGQPLPPDAFSVESRLHVGIDSTSEDPDVNTDSRVPRIYGTCLSLIYFLAFPCAQTAVSAVGCTDTRQYGVDGTPSVLYLNSSPWIACDKNWEVNILPQAIIGIVLWFVAFPIGTTLLYRYLHHRVRMVNDHAVWPLCADLFTPYRHRYWYYEQVLLLRRLALVTCVALIPSDSLYLPISLFALIQISAFIHHHTQAYAAVWLNRGELASLYLLLLNYITALVMHQTSTGSVNGHTLDAWTIMLFLLNLIFILALVAGLFVSVRAPLGRFVERVRINIIAFLGGSDGYKSSAPFRKYSRRTVGHQGDWRAQTQSRSFTHATSMPRHQDEEDEDTIGEHPVGTSDRIDGGHSDIYYAVARDRNSVPLSDMSFSRSSPAAAAAAALKQPLMQAQL